MDNAQGHRQQQQATFDVTLTYNNNSRAMLVSVGSQVKKLVSGMHHRGWQIFEDRTLLLVMSKTDSSKMDLKACMVSKVAFLAPIQALLDQCRLLTIG